MVNSTHPNKDNSTDLGSVTLPPVDILKINILNTRARALESLQKLYMYQSAGVSDEAAMRDFKSHARTLLQYVRSAMSSTKSSSADVTRIKDLLESNEVNKVIEGFELLDDWLYKKHVTKFDTYGQYDATRIEKENANKGL